MIADTENLQTRLNSNALALGATHFGVADFTRASELADSDGDGLPAGYPLGVSIGVATTAAVDDEAPGDLGSGADRIQARHTYGAAGVLLDRISAELAGQIERDGHSALPVLTPIKQISHKLSANLAGLGWIGKSSLMITRKYGPRVRWATVLTDAPLVSTAEAPGNRGRCGTCTLCVDLCPVSAFTGDEFDPGEPVESRFNTQACADYLKHRAATTGKGMCGICINVCPHGWGRENSRDNRRITPVTLRNQYGPLAFKGTSSE